MPPSNSSDLGDRSPKKNEGPLKLPPRVRSTLSRGPKLHKIHHPSSNSSQQHHLSSVIQCIPTSVIQQFPTTSSVNNTIICHLSSNVSQHPLSASNTDIHHSYLHIPISIISHQVDPNIYPCNKSQHIIRHQVDLSNTNIRHSYSSIHHPSSCRSQQYQHLSSVIRYPESYTHIILSVMQWIHTFW